MAACSVVRCRRFAVFVIVLASCALATLADTDPPSTPLSAKAVPLSATCCPRLAKEPLQLARRDRVAFVRPRKVASTTVEHFLTRTLGLCANMCEPDFGACAPCLYTPNCTMTCADDRPEYREDICAGCEHSTTHQLRSYFTRMQLKYVDMARAADADEAAATAALQRAQATVAAGGSVRERRNATRAVEAAKLALSAVTASKEGLHDGGRMHTMALLRDPFDRLVSWYFFTRPTCAYGSGAEAEARAVREGLPLSWLQKANRPDLICNGDFEQFLATAHENEAQTRQLAGVPYYYNVTEEICDKAARVLQQDTFLVLVAERLHEGLALLFKVLDRGAMPTVPTSPLDMHARPTPVDPMRAIVQANSTLREMVYRASPCDRRLHLLANRIFDAHLELLPGVVEEAEGRLAERRNAPSAPQVKKVSLKIGL